MSQRIEYLDTAKLIGLVLVCFCHIPMPEGNFHVWVYAFHMPMFFLLSGLFLRPEKFSLKNSCFQLLVPLLVYNVFDLLLGIVLNMVVDRKLSLPALGWETFYTGNLLIGPGWFLLSLFWMRLFCSYLYIYSKLRGLLIVITILVIALLWSQDYYFWQVLRLGPTVLGLPFYVGGFLIGQRVSVLCRWGGLSITLLLCTISIFSVCNGLVGIHMLSYGNYFVAFLCFACVTSLALVRLSQYIKVPTKILNTFMQGSLFYICMHTLMFEYMLLVWNKITNDFSGNTLMEKIVVTLLTFVVSYPIICMLLHYCPIVLGKQRK